MREPGCTPHCRPAPIQLRKETRSRTAPVLSCCDVRSSGAPVRAVQCGMFEGRYDPFRSLKNNRSNACSRQCLRAMRPTPETAAGELQCTPIPTAKFGLTAWLLRTCRCSARTRLGLRRSPGRAADARPSERACAAHNGARARGPASSTIGPGGVYSAVEHMNMRNEYLWEPACRWQYGKRRTLRARRGLIVKASRLSIGQAGKTQITRVIRHDKP